VVGILLRDTWNGMLCYQRFLRATDIHSSLFSDGLDSPSRDGVRACGLAVAADGARRRSPMRRQTPGAHALPVRGRTLRRAPRHTRITSRCLLFTRCTRCALRAAIILFTIHAYKMNSAGRRTQTAMTLYLSIITYRP